MLRAIAIAVASIAAALTIERLDAKVLHLLPATQDTYSWVTWFVVIALGIVTILVPRPRWRWLIATALAGLSVPATMLVVRIIGPVPGPGALNLVLSVLDAVVLAALVWALSAIFGGRGSLEDVSTPRRDELHLVRGAP